MINQLRDAPGRYELALPGAGGSGDVEVLREMMKLLWTGQTSRHGAQTITRQETQERPRWPFTWRSCSCTGSLRVLSGASPYVEDRLPFGFPKRAQQSSGRRSVGHQTRCDVPFTGQARLGASQRDFRGASRQCAVCCLNPPSLQRQWI